MDASLWWRFLIVLLVLQLFVRPVLLARGFVRPPRLRVTFRTPESWGASYRDVTVVSADGTQLAGWYLPGRNGTTIALLHGHSGNRLATTFHAECLSAEGYGLLMLDLRAHGDSGGRRFAYGQAAVDDVLAAVAFAGRQPDNDGRVGVLGVSAGATLALVAAAQSDRIMAVAADGPAPVVRADYPPPASVLDRVWGYPTEWFFQSVVDRFSRTPRCQGLVETVPRIAPRPVLFLASGSGFEQRLARRLFDRANEPKALVEFPKAGHANAWARAPEPYCANLLRFFDKALAVKPDGEPPSGTPEGSG